jgi:hypothetical protein
MTDILFDQYGHPVKSLVDPDHPEKLFDDYGRPVVVVKDASGLDLAAANAIEVLTKRGIFIPSFNFICMTGSNSGSGDNWSLMNGIGLITGVTPESIGFAYGYMDLSLGSVFWLFNFDRATVLHFFIMRFRSDAEAVAYMQIKDSSPPVLEDMDCLGLGIKIENLTLYGESFGTERGEVDLETNLASMESVEMEIIHTPGVSIEWKVNGVSKGIQDDPDKIPSGISLVTTLFCAGIKNGATGGVDAQFTISNLSLWQSKE